MVIFRNKPDSLQTPGISLMYNNHVTQKGVPMPITLDGSNLTIEKLRHRATAKK
jgi:hypothetical protein